MYMSVSVHDQVDLCTQQLEHHFKIVFNHNPRILLQTLVVPIILLVTLATAHY